MNVSNRKSVAAILLAAVLFGGGAAALAYGTLTGAPRQQQGDEQAVGKKGPPSVADLAKQRLQAAREVYNGLNLQALQGRANLEPLANWAPHLLAAELDAAATPAERLAALKGHVERLKEFEKRAEAAVKVGQARALDYTRARCLRLEAELRLAKEKVK